MLAADVLPSSLIPGGGVWKVAGTNGNIKRTKKATSDRNHMHLLLEDGKLIVPQATDSEGNVMTVPNTRVTAYNNFTLCVMIEFLTEFSDTYKQGYRFVYSSPANMMWNEADDYNTLSMDVNFLCDYRIIDKWFIDGPSDAEKALVFKMPAGKTFEDLLPADITAEAFETAPTVDGTYRVFYDTEIGSGYFCIEKKATAMTPIPMKVAANGAIITAAAGEGEFIEHYCLPIHEFDFITAKFIEKKKAAAISTFAPKVAPSSPMITKK